MNVIKNFLTSGHEFSVDENLQRFRVSFLNVLMLFATLFTFINSMASMLGVVDFGPNFEKATLLHVIISLLVINLLRFKLTYYSYVANFFIVTSFILFYFVLLTRPEDEFRLVAFYLGLFVAYILMGKKYGIVLAAFIVLSIIFLNKQYELFLSHFALSTFFTFFIIFAIFLYFFLKKVEFDEQEFKALNSSLKDRVQKEKQQRIEQEQILLRQCRMENLGEMLDSIAHQWRQPLMHVNAILLNMGKSIDSNTLDNVYLQKKIDEIDTLTQYMSQTIEDFRLLSKTDQTSKEFSIDLVIKDVLFLMQSQFFNIQVNTSLKSVIILNGNKTELMQVLIIVLSNAVEALNLHNIEQKRITIKVMDENEEVVLFIEDNAGGIKQDDIEKIFDPYFTTKMQSGGTGLGLYIAKIITTKMKGEIKVSNTHAGASFKITLKKINAINT